MLLNFAGEVCLYSDSLETLHFEMTRSIAEDGAKFWETLENANDSIKTLQNLIIKWEKRWFEYGSG